MITVTVCVGSSCHIKGSRELIKCFNEILTQENLTDKVELKGSFCLEHCGKGINWMFNDEVICSPNKDEGCAMFRRKVLDFLKEKSPE
ncbi:MAG: hypothetical protein AMJ79_08895 [Phycisphaerae bacterium SM23_30]|nr:MAG: hypothetical protein AMJ79_08895 [Phycisphaerae bacterium SM23_30]